MSKGAPRMARQSRRDLFKTGGIIAGAAVAAGLLVEPARALTTPSGLVVPQASPSGSPWDQVPGILAQITPPTFPDNNFDVTTFGAKGDGTTDDSAAFTK